jgi:hypothetical protein
MHTDAAQTADLHGIEAFAAWARARGFREGDKALDADGRDFRVVQVYDDKFTGLWGIHMCDYIKAADCLLMPSESDLFAYIRSRGFGTISLVLLGGGEEGVELWKHGEWWAYAATTRIGALVAAVKAVEGGER